MSKQTEALKLALEWDKKRKYIMPYMVRDAIREALAEQPAQQEPVAWRHDMGEENGGWEYFEEASCPECQPLYTSPPAQRQCKFPLCHNEEYQQGLAEQIKRELYTGEPAQRKPLTDAQIGAVAADIWGSVLIAPQSYQAFARAIEAAHGIKEKNT